MTKTKKRAAFAVILVSIVLLVCFPQYGLAAVTQSGGNQDSQPQTTLTTGSAFSLSASPTRLYLVVGETGTSKIMVTKFIGAVDFEIKKVDGLNCNIEPDPLKLNNEAGYAVLSVKAESKIRPGSYNVTVTGSCGTTTKCVNVTVCVLCPDFRISGTTIYVECGNPGTSIITLCSVDRFNGTVKLTATPPDNWPSPTFCTNPVTLSYPKNTKVCVNMYVTVPDCAKPGRYVVTVAGECQDYQDHEDHGKSDGLTHSYNVTVFVIKPDFKLYAVPSTMYLLSGASASSIIRVYSVDRFNGTVDLKVAELVTPTGGSLNPTLSPSKGLDVEYNKMASSTLSLTVPANPKFGKYVLEVTGNSTFEGQLLKHSVNVTVYVENPDIAIYSSSLLYVNAGKSANVTVRALSLGRFNGTVTLKATSVPDGLTTKIYSDQLKVAYNESSATPVLITVPAGAESGKYVVTFEGTSSYKVDAKTVNVADTTSVKIIVP